MTAVAPYSRTAAPGSTVRTNTATGSYGWWHKLGCVRVPSALHAYLPADLEPSAVEEALLAMDGLSIEGVAALSPEQLSALAAAVSDRTRWAKTTVSKKRAIAADGHERGGRGGRGGRRRARRRIANRGRNQGRPRLRRLPNGAQG